MLTVVIFRMNIANNSFYMSFVTANILSGNLSQVNTTVLNYHPIYPSRTDTTLCKTIFFKYLLYLSDYFVTGFLWLSLSFPNHYFSYTINPRWTQFGKSNSKTVTLLPLYNDIPYQTSHQVILHIQCLIFLSASQMPTPSHVQKPLSTFHVPRTPLSDITPSNISSYTLFI